MSQCQHEGRYDDPNTCGLCGHTITPRRSGQQHQFYNYCGKCTYLGSTPGYDFYFCGETSLIRYGNEDPEYISTPLNYVPDYGREDATSTYGRHSLALHTTAKALLALHRNPNHQL
jgi:hypothetical protein